MFFRLFFLFFFIIGPCTAYAQEKQTNTFRYLHKEADSVSRVDYIVLEINHNKIINGKYYGNTAEYGFVAELVIRDSTFDQLQFRLRNFQFYDGSVSPEKLQGNINTSIKETIFCCSHGFWGELKNNSLSLRRVFDYYDNRFDEMFFVAH